MLKLRILWTLVYVCLFFIWELYRISDIRDVIFIFWLAITMYLVYRQELKPAKQRQIDNERIRKELREKQAKYVRFDEEFNKAFRDEFNKYL